MKLVALAQQGISFNDVDRLGTISLAKLDLPLETFSTRDLDRKTIMTTTSDDTSRKFDEEEMSRKFSDYDGLFDQYVRERERTMENPLLHRK
jgi:hypothetical protein